MRHLILLCSIILITHVHAAEPPAVLETDWLKPVEGSHGSVLDAEVKGVTRTPDRKGVTLDISLPIDDITSYDVIEVIEKETESSIPQRKPHALIEEYEKDTHGLRLFLKRYPQAGFRIRLIDSDPEKNN